MATRIAAINAYRPKIELNDLVQKPELIRQMARATGLNEGSMDQTIKELRDLIIENNRAGRPVKIEGLGIWTPNIGLDGELSISYRADKALTNGLKTPDTFSANVTNRDNIGKTGDDLVVLWNQDHPDDPVQA